MKRIFIRSSFYLTALSFFVVSCSSPMDEKYLNALPHDAQMVMTVDIADMLSKSGADTNPLITTSLLKQAEGQATAEAFEVLSDILDDKSETGLDFSVPVASAFTMKDESIVVVAKVDDFKKTASALRASADGNTAKFVEEGTMGYLYQDGKFIVAYNESTLLLKNFKRSDNLEAEISYIKGLFAQDSEKSIAKTNQFAAMNDMHGDIKCYVLDEYMTSSEITQLKTMLPEYFVEGDVNALLAAVAFDNGKFSLNFDVYSSNKKINEFFAGNMYAFKNISGSALRMIPAEASAIFCMGIDGAKLSSTIDKSELLAQQTSKTVAVQASRYTKDFNGDLTIALSDLDKTIPNFIATIESTNDELVTTAAQFAPLVVRGGAKKLDEGQYKISINGISPIYFGYNDTYLYVSNDEKFSTDFGASVDESIDNSPLTSNFDSKYFAFSTNNKQFLDSFGIFRSSRDRRMAKEVSKILEAMVDYMELSMSSDALLSFDLYFKDKNANAAKQLSDLAVSIAALQQ